MGQLVISYNWRYATKEFPLKDKLLFLLSWKESAAGLDEVVLNRCTEHKRKAT